MRSVEDHLSLVTAAAVAPRPVRVAISEAQGLMCAEEVVTEHPMPGFDQAAVDGYAVRAVDVALAGCPHPRISTSSTPAVPTSSISRRTNR